MSEMITQKIKVSKGAMPAEWAGADRWTEEDWNRHRLYVEELKSNGEYLKEEEITITYPKDLFDMFKPTIPNIPLSDYKMVFLED